MKNTMYNIVDTIRSKMHTYPEKVAVIDGKRTITYTELFSKVDEAGEILKKLKVGKSTRVGLLCEDSIEYVILSLSVLKLYAVIVPVPFASSDEEIESVLKELLIDVLVFQKGSYDHARVLPLNIFNGFDKKFLICSRPSAGHPPKEFLRMNPAFIRFSSGTTGTRKGVVISHEAIAERTAAANKALRVSSSDSVLWVLSMSFHFVVTILLFLWQGATIILAGNSFPGGLLDALKNHRPTFIYASPLHYHMLSRLPGVTPRELSNVRMAISTALELSPQIAKSFKHKFGFELSQAYGIIEIGLPFVNCSQSVSKRTSVGKILPDYRIKIVKHDSGGAGEIYLKGKGMFSAYFSPWRTTKDILKNGWFDTGDIGRIDTDGFLFILGRSKNVINFNGMKIFPLEVESVIRRYPDIQESRVYGISHPEYGSIPAADIVIKKALVKDFKEDDLRVFCYRHLAKYKVPKYFQIVTSLPKTKSGKIQRAV